MSAETALYTRLTTHSGTAALISTRCYPMLMPQNPTLPAVVYQRVSSSGQQGTTDRRALRFQISSWATTYAGAVALAVQVRGALEDYSNVTIRMGRIVNQIDDFDEATELQRVILDVFITVNE